MFYVYVLKSGFDGNLYTGHTANLRKRVAEHNSGKVGSTRGRVPFELVYYEASRNLSDVIRREKYLKTTYGHRYLKSRLRNDGSHA
jgi:putative endonuclease